MLCAACSHNIVQGGELDLESVRRVARDTAAIRGLDVVDTVETYALDKAAVREYFDVRYSGEMPWLDTDTKVGHKLGILPAHIHLRDLYKRSFTRNAAALYERAWCREREEQECEPMPGRMLIFTEVFPSFARFPIDVMSWLVDTDLIDGLIVSHELVHALQDQHFQLGRVLSNELYATNEDAALARKSVIESEANLVSYAYVFDVDLDAPISRNALLEYLLATRFLSEGAALIANRKSPSFYTKVLTAQYFDGLRFLQRTANAGGRFAAVDVAYKDALPESTEQILWPEKLFGPEYDPPRVFDDAALPGWQHLESNTIGALRMRALLEDPLGAVRAAAVTEGWGGDRYDVFERGERVLFSWRLAFDSEDDAAEFERSYPRVVAAKYPDRIARRTGTLSDDGWTLYRVTPQMPVLVDEQAQPMPGVPTTVVELIAMRRDRDTVLIAEGLDPRRWRVDAERLHAVSHAPISARTRAQVTLPDAPPPPDHGLRRSFFIDHRDVEIRLGLDTPLTVRFGLRPHLEVAFPLVLSSSHAASLGPVASMSVVSAGLISPLRTPGDKGLSVTEVLFASDFALAAQARVEARTDGLSLGTLTTTGVLSLSWRPWRYVHLQLGAGLRLQGDVGARTPQWTAVFGGPLTRAFTPQPTLEVKIIDALHLYELSQVEFDLENGDWRISHSGGILLYF